MTAYLGRNRVFKIGPAANNLTDVSGAGLGLANEAIEESVEVRDIPGGGTSKRRQSLGVKDGQLSFTVDANATTWPLLHRKTGTRLYFEEGPLGGGAGNPKTTGSAIITVSEPIPEGPIVFEVNGPVDGDLTEGVY